MSLLMELFGMFYRQLRTRRHQVGRMRISGYVGLEPHPVLTT